MNEHSLHLLRHYPVSLSFVKSSMSSEQSKVIGPVFQEAAITQLTDNLRSVSSLDATRLVFNLCRALGEDTWTLRKISSITTA